jgi:hypothetical protein
VYPMNGAPSTPTYPYRLIGYAANAPATRNQLWQGDPVRRFVVQHFARTTEGLEAIAADTFATFDGKSIGGDVCTQEVATLPDRDPDDRGVLSTTHTYRY